MLQDIIMPIIGNQVVCVTTDRTVSEFIVIFICFDQLPEIKRLYFMDIRQINQFNQLYFGTINTKSQSNLLLILS